MQKAILSRKARQRILRKIWMFWIARKSLPLAALLAVAVIEGLFVSFYSVILNVLIAADNVKTLSAYLASAIANAELYALVGALVLSIGGFIFLRSIVRDFQNLSSLKQESVSIN